MGICISKNENKDEFISKKVNEVLVNPDSPINYIDPNFFDICPSVCKIIYLNLKASGFLISLNLNDRPLLCLMTNEHVITDSMIKKNETIEVKYDNQKKSIKILLNKKERFIQEFSFLFIDCTIVEIIPKDNIDERYFLLPNIDYLNNYNILKKEKIYIPQFPKGGNLGYSEGQIQNIKDELFSHNANTLPGSSGSPIFLVNTNKVIGIHKGSNEEKKANFGFFIFPIMKALKNFVTEKKQNSHIIKSDNLNKNSDNLNYILAECDLENNENVRIINSYENYIREFYGEIHNKNKNEEFIKQIQIQIDNKDIPFNYRFKLDKGKHKIKYIIKDTNILTNLNFLFFDCSKLTNLDLSHFKTKNVTDISFMFSRCKSLSNLNLSNFNTKQVTNMEFLFSWCESLTFLNLSSFNTENVNNMEGMFFSCKLLSCLNLQNFNTQKVTNMEKMFCMCKSLIYLRISSFNTQNVTNMLCMFSGCESLTNIYLDNFNTQNVRNMQLMFSYCTSLTDLQLSNFNTKNVVNMFGMFLGCESLTNLNISNFNTKNAVHLEKMFSLCKSLDKNRIKTKDPKIIKQLYSYDDIPNREEIKKNLGIYNL